MKEPTRQARERYIHTGGVRCPLCGSEQIEGGPLNCEAGYASQEVRCLDCEGEWSDVYKLVAIENPDWPEEQPTRPKHPNKDALGTGSKTLPLDLGGVDWKMLRKQKESLLRAISIVDVQISKKCQEDLTGILHLLDHVQDQAAERIGERAVFGRIK